MEGPSNRIRRPTRENIFTESFDEDFAAIIKEADRDEANGDESFYDSLANGSFTDLSSAYQCSSYTSPENRITLSWSHLSVDVVIPADQQPGTQPSIFSKIFKRQAAAKSAISRQKRLLRSIYGIAQPGFILAIIGSSGAGKSTLMNILMGKISKNFVVKGKVQANGAVIGKDIGKWSAYLQQEDVFHPNITVGEHMWFHAKLRMPEERYTDKDRREKIRSILHELGLTACKNTLIGGASSTRETKTLSGGERKRLAFATEILTNPSVFFCDEPTTGLDSFMAENVVQSMKHLAERGKTVVCTLHQPSSQIISLLDNVLILTEGRLVYHGSVKHLTDYFASIGQACPPSYNPFDHVLAVLSSPEIKIGKKASAIDHSPQSEQVDFGENEAVISEDTRLRKAQITKADALATMFHDSKYYKSIRDDVKASSKIGSAGILLQQRIEVGFQPASAFMQYKMCFWRAVKTTFRDRRTFAGRIFSTLFFGTMYSLLFANQQYDQKGVMNFVGLMYQMVTLAVWENLEPYAMAIPGELPIYMREQQQQLYSPFAYLLSRMLVEAPQILVFSLTYMTMVYLSSNMVRTAEHFFYAVLIHATAGWCASGIGYIVGFAVDNLAISNGVRRAIGPFLSFTAGLYINLETIPAWIRWIRFLSPTFYANELMQINQWSSITSLECDDFYSSDNACFKNGLSVLEYYSFSVNDVTRNVLAMIALIFGFRFIAFLVLLLRTYQKKNEA